MKNKFLPILTTLLFVATIVSSNFSLAQLEYPDDKVSWKFSIQQDGDEAYIVGKITMVEHWHIYAANLPEGTFTLPTTIELKPSSDFKVVGKVIEPKPIHEHDEMADEDLYYHSNTVTLKRKIKITSEEDFTLTGTFGFQTCDDTHCLPPFEVEFKLKVKGVSEDEVKEEPKIEDLLTEVNGDEAVDADGQDYVKVNDKWFAVPNGNSSKFYKKYLTLGGSHEE